VDVRHSISEGAIVYLYSVGVSRNGVCSRIAVLANSYNDAMAEVEAEGYTVTPAFDIRPMAYETVLISKEAKI
jgi:hypothetical protein